MNHKSSSEQKAQNRFKTKTTVFSNSFPLLTISGLFQFQSAKIVKVEGRPEADVSRYIVALGSRVDTEHVLPVHKVKDNDQDGKRAATRVIQQNRIVLFVTHVHLSLQPSLLAMVALGMFSLELSIQDAIDVRTVPSERGSSSQRMSLSIQSNPSLDVRVIDRRSFEHLQQIEQHAGHKPSVQTGRQFKVRQLIPDVQVKHDQSEQHHHSDLVALPARVHSEPKGESGAEQEQSGRQVHADQTSRRMSS
jgi:hypothetical protein